MRVLIIEDNTDIVANLYAYLEPLGYALDCEHRATPGSPPPRTVRTTPSCST